MGIYVYAAGVTALVAAAVFFAAVPPVRRWIQRIHIGRWNGEKSWKTAVENRLIKQMKSPPHTTVTDNERWRFFENLKHKNAQKNLQSWQFAALLLAAESLGLERSRVAADLVRKTGLWDANAVAPDFWNKPESAMLAYAAMPFPAPDAARKDAVLRRLAQTLLDAAGPDGTVPYNAALPTIRFVDTIGMACPFLFRFAYEYGERSAAELALRQIEEYFEHGVHPLLGLPVHCFDIHTQAPLGIFGWGRGCGWLAVGLTDSYKTASVYIGKERGVAEPSEVSPHAVCETLLPLMRALADAVGRFQMDNGGWDRQLPVRQTGESSATAMLRLFMAEMYAITADEKYNHAARRAQEFLLSCTRRDGTVDYAQGDTHGIGFYSARLDSLPAAQGFTVRGNQ